IESSAERATCQFLVGASECRLYCSRILPYRSEYLCFRASSTTVERNSLSSAAAHLSSCVYAALLSERRGSMRSKALQSAFPSERFDTAFAMAWVSDRLILQSTKLVSTDSLTAPPF